MLNQTLFFVKYKHIYLADDIFNYVQQNLGSTENLLIQSRTIVTPDEQTWREFYKHLAKSYPQALEKMAQDFADKPIDMAVLFGHDIAKRTKNLTGKTYGETNLNTIRGAWGPTEKYHTIVHSSNPEAVKKDMAIMLKYIEANK